MKFNNSELNYNEPIEINEGVYWVGFTDDKHNLQCNPYLILDGNEAVLIDGGSRPDFSKIMMKVLQVGVDPSSIKALIYHHYDPDLCGSVSNLEEIINNEDLKIISHTENNVFIKHYTVKSPLISITNIGYEYTFSSGRKLKFYTTPYSHSPGSFITFDEKSGVLFTSDIFGSYQIYNGLFLEMEEGCKHCTSFSKCTHETKNCPLKSIFYFQKKIMTSDKALQFALNKIKNIPAEFIAPQHGSVISSKASIDIILEKLQNLKGVGIDGYIESDING